MKLIAAIVLTLACVACGTPGDLKKSPCACNGFGQSDLQDLVPTVDQSFPLVSRGAGARGPGLTKG
jgi:hypothetical protein